MEGFIHAAVARAQAADHNPTDSLRGLIISDSEVHQHLARGVGAEDSPLPDLYPIEALAEAESPFAHLVNIFDLNRLDVNILLLCLAPEFERRYERLYAYLQDDVSQRRPTVHLLMNLLGQDSASRFAVWERLAAGQPLRHFSLVQCQGDSGQPAAFLATPLRVDYRLVAYLLGETTPDERLKGAVERLEARSSYTPAMLNEPVWSAVIDSPIFYLQGREGVGRRETAAALCARYDLPLIGADLARLTALDIGFTLAWQLAIREAYLAGAALLLTKWESCFGEDGSPPAELWNTVQNYGYPVFLCGKGAWEPQNLNRVRRVLRVNFEIPTYDERLRLWIQAVEPYQSTLETHDFDQLANKFRFTPAQITRSVDTAADLAAARGDTIRSADLYAGAGAHSTLRLGRLAHQIVPRYTWEDLILPPDRLAQLHELRARAEYAHLVHEIWGFGRKIASRPGVSALFAGESGTGKTLASEVIAGDLGLPMYRIDLSSVVSKYIGETEKNLSAIFEEAQTGNAILFFDEADALFGKRSEVKDAHDRYANIEIAYLLQQIEDYEGIVILATNLRQNLDEAFTRRLDFLVDFPFPEADYRKRIWQTHFPPEAPLARDINLDEIAARYPLAGGNIRNAALASAYLAAADGKVVTMQHIRNAIRREHQKMGRLVEDEF